ncbi:hypothetical protein RAA17_10475 [Komagataeibacter rhaeticus]|nr:hypothetical protein [Komagataeibacter rhaeticus]
MQTSAPMFTRVSVGGSSFATTYAEPNDIPAMTKATDLGSYLSVEDASGTGTGSIQKVTVQIASATAEDVLAASTAGGITASMDSATGTLTLTAGTATTLQDWRSTLASLQYYDSSDTPVVGMRNVSISVFENGVSAPIVTNGTIAVIAANDSPILDPSVPVSLNDAQEDSGPPQGAVGTSVSQLVGYAGATGGAGNVTDPDGAGLTGQTAAGVTPLPGIAITSADTTHGTWWYSINNGRTWTEFAGSGVSNAIGADSALHLIDNGQARVYFQSTDPNWNGKVNDALTFRAWDQCDGAANGSISTLPAVAGLGTGINTPGSAYSSAVDSVGLMDDNVNDAPNVVASNSDPGATPVTGAARFVAGNGRHAAGSERAGPVWQLFLGSDRPAAQCHQPGWFHSQHHGGRGHSGLHAHGCGHMVLFNRWWQDVDAASGRHLGHECARTVQGCATAVYARGQL